jgi:hypothetical protein
MIIYLAGGVTGNIVQIYRNAVESLASSKHQSKQEAIEEAMRIYLGAIKGRKPVIDGAADVIPFVKDFLLDSGAFSFINEAGNVDFDSYVEEYARYINANKIKYFFELDIDCIVGLKEVERLRAKLEALVGRQCIPVWHKSRGKEYWAKMCAEYDYVAIGGIVTKEFERKDWKYFPYFLDIAAKHKTKVHGLGFTSLADLELYPFYSVDSTAWLYGNRGGFLYRFNGKRLDKIDAPKGVRLKAREAALHNFLEWVKYQKYAEANL